MPVLSIKTKMSLVVVCACLALVAPGSFTQVRLLRNDFAAQLAARQSLDITRAAEQIDDRLQFALAALADFGNRLPQSLLADPKALRQHLTTVPLLRQAVDDVLIVDVRGKVIADDPPIPGRIGTDLSTRPEWRDTLLARQARIMAPVMSRGRNEPLLPLVSPVFDSEGTVIALVLGLLWLHQDNFLGRLASTRLGKEGHYALVTRDDNAVHVMHPDRNRILQPYRPEAPRQASGTTTGLAIDESGREVLLARRALRATDWELVSVLPTDEAMAPLRRMQQRALLAALLVLLIGTPLAWLLVNRMLGPLYALHQAIRRARTPGSEFQAVPVLRRDELGELTRAFNELMHERITRTAEIEAMNDASPNGMFRTAADGRLVYANRTLGLLLGLPHQHLALEDWLAVIDEDDRARSAAQWSQAIRERTGFGLRQRVRPGGGSERLLSVTAAPIVVEGQLMGFAGLVEDVTERAVSDEARRILAAILDRSTDLVAMSDPSGRLRYANPAAMRFRGYASLEQVVGTTIADHFPPEVVSRLNREAVPQAARDGVWSGETTIWDSNHREVLVQHMVLTGRTAEGRLEFIASIMRDISDQQRAQRALRDSEAHLRAITDNMPALVSYVDTTQCFRYANRTYADWLGIDPASLIGTSVRELYGDAVYERVGPQLRRALDGEVVEYERELQTITHVRQVHATLIPHRDEQGAVLGVHALINDITARTNEERRLRQLSLVDPLTGLLNRTGFDLRLDEAIVHARQSGSLMALMYLDIDHFKSINDNHGHPAGDALLRAFAQRLRSVLRNRDAICRMGGDEFTLVLEALDRSEDAARVADKIIEVMREPFDLDGRILLITASLGVAFHDGGALGRHALERRADDALYSAKRAGRNRYRLDPATSA